MNAYLAHADLPRPSSVAAPAAGNPATAAAQDYLRSFGYQRAHAAARIDGADDNVCRRINAMVRTWRNGGRKGW